MTIMKYLSLKWETHIADINYENSAVAMTMTMTMKASVMVMI